MIYVGDQVRVPKRRGLRAGSGRQGEAGGCCLHARTAVQRTRTGRRGAQARCPIPPSPTTTTHPLKPPRPIPPIRPPAQDFICNYVGNQQWVDVLPWHGAAKWPGAAEESWLVDGEQAGSVRAVGPLSFVRVFGAGHMVRSGGGGCRLVVAARGMKRTQGWRCFSAAGLNTLPRCLTFLLPLLAQPPTQVPMDQGKHALDMITRFTRNMPLASTGPAAAAGASAGETSTAAATDAAAAAGDSAAADSEAAPMKRGVGEQHVLAGATWRMRRAGAQQ